MAYEDSDIYDNQRKENVWYSGAGEQLTGLGIPTQNTFGTTTIGGGTKKDDSSWTSSIGKVSPGGPIYNPASGQNINSARISQQITQSLMGLPTLQPYPTLSLPTYKAPEWDETRDKYYSQQQSMPYVTEIRRAIKEAILRSGATTSPVLRRYMLGEVASNASSGLGKVMSQARQYGQQAYGNEWNRTADEAKTNYLGGVQTAIANNQAEIANVSALNQSTMSRSNMLFQAALKDYMGG